MRGDGMTSVPRRVLPLLLLVVGTLAFVFYLVSGLSRSLTLAELDASFTVAFGMFLPLGTFIAIRRPTNRIGWLMIAIGFSVLVSAAAIEYATRALLFDPGSLPAGEEVAFASELLGIPGIALLPVLMLVFPTGHLPSPRWRWVSRFAIGNMVFIAVLLSSLWPVRGPKLLREDIPDGFFPQELFGIGWLVLMSTAVAGLVSLVVRFRRSSGIERQQLKWMAYFASVVIALIVLNFFVLELLGFADPTHHNVAEQALNVAVAGIPVAAAIAISRYRLYDIDVVINKTIVFGGLAVFITSIYVAIVVGAGTLLGSRDEPNLALSIAATAVVAIAFSPVKERTQRLANRLVYGHRLSPYEVLADLSHTVAAAAGPEGVLEGVADAARAGANATAAVVTVRLHEGGEVRASWPRDLPEKAPEQQQRLPVVHLDEEIGELIVMKKEKDPFTSQDRDLMESVAAQAGLALHNARLALELKARLNEISSQADELRSSRARIVSAADDARRRLEEQITTGPRAGLVALRTGLMEAEGLVGSDPEACASRLEVLKEDANRTLEALRELARGIYPPLLADKGIAAAIESHVRKHELAVDLDISEKVRDQRFEESLETSLYFCCLEVLDRTAEPIVLSVQEADGLLICSFASVPDDETVTRIVDRVDALGGAVDIRDGLVLRLPFEVSEVAA